MNFCWQGHGEFLLLAAFLSHSFLEPMHLCIRNFGCHNVLICLNYLVQGIVKTIEITYFRKYGNGLLWSFIEFCKVKVYNTISQCVYTFFFLLGQINFFYMYLHTRIPMFHISLDCRGLEELFHKKKKTWLFIVMDPMRVSYFKLSDPADGKYVCIYDFHHGRMNCRLAIHDV